MEEQGQHPEIPAPTWTEFRSNVMNLIFSASQDDPRVNSMKAKLIDDENNDFSPFCSLMQCVLRTKTIRSLLSTSTSLLFQSIQDYEDCPVPLPNRAWTQLRVRDFLLCLCQSGCFVKCGRSETFLMNKFKELIMNATATDRPDSFVLFCTLMNLLEEATDLTNNQLPPPSNGFSAIQYQTRTCTTCGSQLHNEEKTRSIDLELNRLRRFHLYFIPLQPWSRQTKNFPLKKTLSLSTYIRVDVLIQLAKQFMPNVAVDQWKPFQAQKKFAEMKMLSLDVTLGAIDASVTKICFYQFVGNNFSLLKVRKVSDVAPLEFEYLPIPPVLVPTFGNTLENKNNLLTSLADHLYMKIIRDSSRVLQQLIVDARDLNNGTGEVSLALSNFDDRKLKLSMWHGDEEGSFIRVKQWLSWFWQSIVGTEIRSIHLNDLLSQHFKAIVSSFVSREIDCLKCQKKQQCRIESSLFEAPDDLVIHLRKQQRSQNKFQVILPHELDLTQFMFDAPTQPIRYKLTGIVSKEQNRNNEDIYYAQCLLQSENRWEKLSQQQNSFLSQIKSDDAVLLFYERV